MIINRILHLPKFIYRNIVQPRVLSRKYRDILSKNLEIKNVHKAKRCFILGSGPSIKDLNILQLANEYTFVVNEFNRHPDYRKLNRNHHILSDVSYFSDDYDTLFGKEIKAKSDNTNPNTLYFINIAGKKTVEKRELFAKNKMYYFGTQGIISQYFDFNIELDKFLPWPKNTMLIALMTAVYMGFEDIYMLGVEHNFLAYNIGIKELIYDHFYSNDDIRKDLEKINKSEESKRIHGIDKKSQMNYEENIANVLQLFKNYRLFKNKIRKIHPNIKIYNATPNSFLDVFPSINFKDIKF